MLVKNDLIQSVDTGRWYDANGAGLAAEVAPPLSDAEAEWEVRAEYQMSWVCGGGSAEDAMTAYALGLGR